MELVISHYRPVICRYKNKTNFKGKRQCPQNRILMQGLLVLTLCSKWSLCVDMAYKISCQLRMNLHFLYLLYEANLESQTVPATSRTVGFTSQKPIL